MRFRFWAIVLWSAVSSLACTIEIGDYDPPPKPVSNFTLADARSFREFPLYWLGPEYEGLPLTYIGFMTDADGVHHVSFWYGEPEHPGHASANWRPPLEVDIQAYCGWAPEEFLYWVDRYIESDVEELEVRGVQAYLQTYSAKEENLYVWTENASVGLSTSRTEWDLEAAGQDLIPIDQDELPPMRASLPPVTSTDC